MASEVHYLRLRNFRGSTPILHLKFYCIYLFDVKCDFKYLHHLFSFTCLHLLWWHKKFYQSYAWKVCVKINKYKRYINDWMLVCLDCMYAYNNEFTQWDLNHPQIYIYIFQDLSSKISPDIPIHRTLHSPVDFM